MREVTLAATQMDCDWDRDKNVANAIDLAREAADRGAQIILIQELFETPYFCADQKEELFSLAHPVEDHPLLKQMSEVAAELEVVLPVSFFERANGAYFNALAIIDADGSHLGTYRKSHIPDGPGYQEKYYFNPGNTGFLAWKTRYATIGAAICWDQWFPEAARAMCLQGAEVLFYPTAIGNELHGEKEDLTVSGDSMRSWQREYLATEQPNYRPSLKNWGPISVPPDSFLVMGDNRDNSYDSRYWGFLGRDRIDGRPLFIYYSYNKKGMLPLPFITAIRWKRIFSTPD